MSPVVRCTHHHSPHSVEAIGNVGLSLSVEATPDASTGTRTTARTADLLQPAVLVPEHAVMFGTAAAVRPRRTPITRRMIGALRVVAAALRPPPPRPHYADRAWFLESACMSREMGRL
jgi:hypothetical protein